MTTPEVAPTALSDGYKSRYRLDTRPSANTRRSGYAQLHPNLDNHPNFVFLLTDDQENVPDEGTPGMRYTFPMMREFGTTLQNFFSNVPICCPSRTTLFTGRYPHRWFVPRDDACMHMNVSSQDFANANMGVNMKQYGYTTGCFGKTLNFELKTQYCSETSETAEVFPGWDSSFTLCNEFLFNNNVWNVNGSMLHTTDYMTSLIGNHSLAFINSRLQSGKPFFAYIGVHAPHLYSEPAPWYKDEFPDLVAPQTPNFNFSGSTHHYLLHNTYVIWRTSDHGYQLGGRAFKKAQNCPLWPAYSRRPAHYHRAGRRSGSHVHGWTFLRERAQKRLEQLFEYPMECELFDLNKDKEQMWNLCGVPEAHIQGDLNRVRVELRDHLHSQIHCSGQIECVFMVVKVIRAEATSKNMGCQSRDQLQFAQAKKGDGMSITQAPDSLQEASIRQAQNR
eukprot:Em0006g1020a